MSAPEVADRLDRLPVGRAATGTGVATGARGVLADGS